MHGEKLLARIAPRTAGFSSCEVGQQSLYQPPVSTTSSEPSGRNTGNEPWFSEPTGVTTTGADHVERDVGFGDTEGVGNQLAAAAGRGLPLEEATRRDEATSLAEGRAERRLGRRGVAARVDEPDGAEIEAAAQPLERLHIGASLGWLAVACLVSLVRLAEQAYCHYLDKENCK